MKSMGEFVQVCMYVCVYVDIARMGINERNRHVKMTVFSLSYIFIDSHNKIHAHTHTHTHTQLMRDRRGWPRMPTEELQELREKMIMSHTHTHTHLQAIHAHHQKMKTDPHTSGIRVTWVCVCVCVCVCM
jgi:hypothetical protein